MRTLNEEITEEFIDQLINQSVKRLESALEAIDVSVDYVAALLSGDDPLDMKIRQKNMGRQGRPSATMPAHHRAPSVPDTE